MFAELIKRLCNLVLCWAVVAILPAFCFTALVAVAVYKIVMGHFPSQEVERFFRMFAFGAEGAFDLRPEEEVYCEECEDEGCELCEEEEEE